MLERIGRLIEVEMANLDEHLPRELTKIANKHAAQGVLKSGRTVRAYLDVAEREIGARASIVWKAIVRVLRTHTVPLSESLADDLKGLLVQQIDAETA